MDYNKFFSKNDEYNKYGIEYFIDDKEAVSEEEIDFLYKNKRSNLLNYMPIILNGKQCLCFLLDDCTIYSRIEEYLESFELLSIVKYYLLTLNDFRIDEKINLNQINLQDEVFAVDEKTLKVRLIYFPLSKTFIRDDEETEKLIKERTLVFLKKVYSKGLKIPNLIEDVEEGLDGEVLIERIERILKKVQNGIPNENMPRLMEEKNTSSFKIILDKRYFTFGRSILSSDIAIPIDSSISRKHGRILRRNGKIFLIDEGNDGKGSRYGTYVNDDRIAPNKEIEIKKDDIIKIGLKTEFIVK